MKNVVKFFFIMFFILLGIITHGRLASIFNNDYYETETVFTSSVANAFSGEAFIFREETLIKFDQEKNLKKNNKIIDYLIKDGEKVSADQVIAVVYDSDKDINSIYNLANIKEELDLLSEMKILKNKKSMSSEILYSQIISNLGDFIDSSNRRTIIDLKKEKHDLFLSLFKKNLVHNKTSGLDEKIEDLKKQEENYNNIKYDFRSVLSPNDGYFYSQLDGYEKGILNKSEIETLLSDNFLDYDSCVKALKSFPKKIDTDKYIGKIVTDFDWYIILKTNKKNIENLRPNSLVEIDYDVASFKKIPAVVLNIDEGNNDKDCAIVLKSNYISKDILNLRKKKVTVSTKSFHGLIVNMKAIRFFNGEKGVFVRDDKEVKFKKIDVIFETEQKIISKLRPLESEYLQAFDEVILSGQGLYDGKIVD